MLELFYALDVFYELHPATCSQSRFKRSIVTMPMSMPMSIPIPMPIYEIDQLKAEINILKSKVRKQKETEKQLFQIVESFQIKTESLENKLSMMLSNSAPMAPTIDQSIPTVDQTPSYDESNERSESKPTNDQAASVERNESINLKPTPTVDQTPSCTERNESNDSKHTVDQTLDQTSGAKDTNLKDDEITDDFIHL
jgi:hypothetical protein